MEKSSKESTATTSCRMKVLMFPWLAQSHISSFIELSKRLVKSHNFQAYLCSTEINLSFIKKNNDLEDYLSDDSMKLVQLDMPNLPDLPPHYHTTRNVPPNLFQTLHVAFNLHGKASFQEILNDLKPDLLIYDASQPWASEQASLIHIPSVLFLISGAVNWSWLWHHSHLAPSKGFSSINDTSYPFPAIFLRDYEIKKMAADAESFMKNIPEETMHDLSPTRCFEVSSDIVLVKSWRGIEGKYINHLSSCCGKEVIPVGPLAQLKKHIDEEENSPHDDDLVKFLNDREDLSVVYVAFGSECFLSEEEREEMAYGLELSSANFIWAVRFPAGHAIALEEALPEGFLERVKGKGVVTDGWVPQARILAHPGIGGFLSHCGWGSFMESIYNGVPLLALPMNFIQPHSARLGVEIGVAVEILKDGDGKIKRENVAEVIKEVIVEKKEVGGLLKQTAMELSRKLRDEGEKDLDEAVQKLRSLCSKNKMLKE